MNLIFSSISLLFFFTLFFFVSYDFFVNKYYKNNIFLLIASLLYVIFQCKYIITGEYQNSGAEWGTIEILISMSLIYQKIKQINNGSKHRKFAR